jgi:integrase
LHDLRHFVATTLLAAGVPISTVAGRLGHARASTTLNVYSHFIAATDHHAADVIGRLLVQATGDPKGD